MSAMGTDAVDDPRPGIGARTRDFVGSIWADKARLRRILMYWGLGLILAIAAYATAKGQDLVRPMITGVKMLPSGVEPPSVASPLRAAALLGVSALGVAALANFL